jgi:hypothetical protein
MIAGAKVITSEAEWKSLGYRDVFWEAWKEEFSGAKVWVVESWTDEQGRCFPTHTLMRLPDNRGAIGREFFVRDAVGSEYLIHDYPSWGNWMDLPGYTNPVLVVVVDKAYWPGVYGVDASFSDLPDFLIDDDEEWDDECEKD